MSSVRFKFRSSATFDSVDIGELSSISIRDLKSRIVLKKHLNLCHDFDLVFSDSDSGLEYKDENIWIPSGSSVIIKRVPAKSSPLRASDNSPRGFGVRDAKCVDVTVPSAVGAGVNDFDDLGANLCPPPQTNLSGSGLLILNNNEKKDNMVPRCSQELLVRCQKLEADHPGQSIPKDSSANEGSTLVMPKPKIVEQIDLASTYPAQHLVMENSDMPSELKCSLCRTFFKEAVMIPCCQHSFCGKCIREALSETSKCPMCSSTRCKPEDLLPNVSLRQAIERFLLLNGSEKELHRYAPDGESGIQVKEISYATPVLPKCLPQDRSHLADKCTPGALEDFSEFQGENDPQNVAGTNEEVSCSKKGQVSPFITRGGEKNFLASGRQNKGPRTCFMCGSPDHLVRDCPGAVNCSTSHWNGVASVPGAFSGYPPTYWPGSPPYSRPFMNMYGGPGMMFYNTSTSPISPIAFPSCAPSMYGGYPVVSGYMNVGGMTPAAGNFVQQPRHVDHLELQGCAKQQRNYCVDLESERMFDRNHSANTHHGAMERGPYQSGDYFARRSEGKHINHGSSDGENAYTNCNRQGESARHVDYGRDHRKTLSDRYSEKDALDSRIQPREGRHEKLHRSLRTNDDIGEQHGRESVRKHHQPKEESSKRKRMEYDGRKSDRHSHSRSRSSLEPSYSGDDSRHRREESSHRSRHSKVAKLWKGDS